MDKSKVLVSFVIVLYVLFVGFEFTGNHDVSFYLDSLITPSIALMYIFFVKNKNIYFLLFLLFYAVADAFVLILEFFPAEKRPLLGNYKYFVANSMYIIAYTLLFVKIVKSLCISHLFKNFKIHIIVLTILNLYLLYVLQVIVEPNIVMNIDYYFEMLYNIVTLLLLSAALLNYFHKDTQKSLYLFLGVLCIVFSEVIDIAFIYVAKRSVLSFLATTLSLGAFCFLYYQSKMLNKSRDENEFMLTD